MCAVLDGTPIAVTGGDNTIQVWDLTTGRRIGELFPGPTHEVLAVACTVLDDTSIAVTGGNDGTVLIWDLRARRLMQSIVAPACRDVAFTSDGRIVVLLGRDIAVFERI